MTECEVILRDLQGAAMPLYLLLTVAAGALIWQWIDDAKRDRICDSCSSCRKKIHGTPPLPPPSAGVKG